MQFKKEMVFLLLFCILIPSVYSDKKIIAYSTNNITLNSNHDLLNKKLKERMKKDNLEYYYADSFFNEQIQYYSVIDMLNKNANTLILNPVNQNSYERVVELCDEYNVKLINLYFRNNSKKSGEASIYNDFRKSAKIIADDIIQQSLVKNKNYSVNFLVNHSMVESVGIIKYLETMFNDNNVKIDHFFLVYDKDLIIDFVPLLASQNTDNSIIIFSNVNSAVIFHNIMIKKYGCDNFIKYCLSGCGEQFDMIDYNIRGVLVTDNDALANHICDIIETDNFKDAEIFQVLKTF